MQGQGMQVSFTKKTRNSSLEINLLKKGGQIFLLFKTFLKYWLLSKGNFLIFVLNHSKSIAPNLNPVISKALDIALALNPVKSAC